MGQQLFHGSILNEQDNVIKQALVYKHQMREFYSRQEEVSSQSSYPNNRNWLHSGQKIKKGQQARHVRHDSSNSNGSSTPITPAINKSSTGGFQQLGLTPKAVMSQKNLLFNQVTTPELQSQSSGKKRQKTVKVESGTGMTSRSIRSA